MDVFGGVAAEQRGYLRAAVLHAARSLQVSEVLPATAAAAARALGLRGERRLLRLLEALALFGLVRREGETFHAGPQVSEVSHPHTSETFPGATAGWGLLAQVIRDDRPIPEPTDDDSLLRFHRYLTAAGAESAKELWEIVAAEGPLIDLGGGFGVYTRAFLARHPGSAATLVDRSEVLRLVDGLPEASLAEGDLLNIQPTPEAGVALLANVLHLFGPGDCLRIVRTARAALRPGGQLIIKDLLVEPGRNGPAEGVLFALNMSLFTPSGDVHDPAQLESFILAAGFEPPRRVLLACSPSSIVLVARAP